MDERNRMDQVCSDRWIGVACNPAKRRLVHRTCYDLLGHCKDHINLFYIL